MVEYYFPHSLSPSRLDRYLAGGWFRSGPSLFRSQMLCLDGDVHAVVNIRSKLDDFSFSKSLRKLLRKNDRRFRVEFGMATMSPQKEQLYTCQKGRFKGYIFDTLEDFLFSKESPDLFETREIRVYDGNKLVAASFFDLGQKSMSSLIGLYDPGMKQHSLGVYTMAVEVRYAMELGLKYYYPGYILKNFPNFDYKLKIGNTQYYNWSGRWKAIDKITNEKFIVSEIQRATRQMEALLNYHGINYRKRLYPFFSIGYLDLLEDDFLKSVIFLSLTAAWSSLDPQRQLIIEFDLEEKKYAVSWIRINEDYDEFLNAEFSEDFFNEQVFDEGLLVREEVLYRDSNPQKVIDKVQRYLREEPGSLIT